MDISLPKPCANEQLSSSSLTLAAESSFTLSNVYEKKLEDDVEVSSKVELDEEITFPEGGLTAWLAILGGFLIQFTCFGYINSFGVYQDYYVRKYLTNYSSSAIGWIGSVQIFLNFIVGAVTGRIFDKGYFYSLNIASVILHGLGLFTLSLSHENSYYQVFLSHGIAFGLASGLSYVPSVGLASHYFYKKRPLAVGIITSGSAFGAVVHPIMLNHFFHGQIGFRNGIRISAAINTFLLVLAVLIMRTRLPQKNLQRFLVLQWFTEVPYTVFLLACIFGFLGIFYPLFYLQLDAVIHGVDKSFAFYATSILNAAGFFGRCTAGLLAAFVGIVNLTTLMTICTGVVLFCMIMLRDKESTILFSIFFGFFSGGAIALTAAIAASLANNAAEIGMRIGLSFAVGGIVALFAIPVSGALLTSGYFWTRPIVFAGIMMCICSMCFGIVGILLARRKKTWKV